MSGLVFFVIVCLLLFPVKLPWLGTHPSHTNGHDDDGEAGEQTVSQ
jgi:hypothetical protein